MDMLAFGNTPELLEISYNSQVKSEYFTQAPGDLNRLQHIEVSLAPHEKVNIQRSIHGVTTSVHLENINRIQANVELFVNKKGEFYMVHPNPQTEMDFLFQNPGIQALFHTNQILIPLASTAPDQQVNKYIHQSNPNDDQDTTPNYQRESFKQCQKGGTNLLLATTKFLIQSGHCTLSAGTASAHLIQCAIGLGAMAKGLGSGTFFSGLGGIAQQSTALQSQLLTLGSHSFEMGLGLSHLVYGIGQFAIGYGQEKLIEKEPEFQGIAIEVRTQTSSALDDVESNSDFLRIQEHQITDDYVMVNDELSKFD